MVKKLSFNNLDEKNKKIALMIVPTGIGASIGGYAGDASQMARKISQHLPLIVNPNIVNAAVFSGINENMYYVEGCCINDFVKGTIALKPSTNNKIGIIFDKKKKKKVLNIHINTINAVKTIYGIDVIGYEITKKEVGVSFFETENKISSGGVKNPTTLIEAGRKLIDKGAQTIAVVCSFDEPPEDDYENGEGVDIVGGIEAVISHYLYKNLGCPCVHAPAFEDVTISTDLVSPKVSAEYITPTFLPCLLFGLKNAPLPVKLDKMNTNSINGNIITYKNLHSLVVPYNAVGSSAVLDAIQNNIPVYAVKENKTVLNIDSYAINKQNDIIEIDSYDNYIDIINNGVIK